MLLMQTVSFLTWEGMARRGHNAKSRTWELVSPILSPSHNHVWVCKSYKLMGTPQLFWYKGSTCVLFCIRDTLHFIVCQQYVTLNSAVVILRKFTPSFRVCTEMLFSTNYLHKQHLMLHDRSQTPAVVRMSFAPGSKHGSEHIQICIHT